MSTDTLANKSPSGRPSTKDSSGDGLGGRYDSGRNFGHPRNSEMPEWEVVADSEYQTLRQILYDKIKIAAVAVLFLLTVPLLLLMFPIFILTTSQIAIRLMLVSVQYYRRNRTKP
jgi:hypothetical protein